MIASNTRMIEFSNVTVSKTLASLVSELLSVFFVIMLSMSSHKCPVNLTKPLSVVSSSVTVHRSSS